MNAIMYLVKTGCQWRMLTKDFPPYNTVFYCFNKWKLEGVFDELMDKLHVLVRNLMGREDTPSLGIIDSRSIKWSSDLTNPQRSSRFFPCDGLWRGLSRGWKTSEGLPWTTNFTQKPEWRWFNSPSAGLCITKFTIEI